MSDFSRFHHRLGDWAGTNLLWLQPDMPGAESPTTAQLTTVGQGKFLLLRYTWDESGTPQDGLLMIGAQEASWIDSWHMGNAIMTCTVTEPTPGVLSLAGGYAAPPGPDWGWRIALDFTDPDHITLRMFNQPPQSTEERAVEARYTRR